MAVEELKSGLGTLGPSGETPLGGNLRRRFMSKNRRILVIDDNPSIQADFRKILSHDQDSARGLRDMEASLFGETADTRPAVTFDVDCATQGQEGYQMALEAA